MRAGFAALQAAAAAPGGYATLSRVFGLCAPLRTAADLEHLVLWAVNSFVNLAMMDYPYPTNFLAPLPGFPVNESCALMAAAASPLEALAVCVCRVWFFFVKKNTVAL